MKEAAKRAFLFWRGGRRVRNRDSVCPHCGASPKPSALNFVVACILIAFGVVLVGHYVASLYYFMPVIEEFEREMKQPFPRTPAGGGELDAPDPVDGAARGATRAQLSGTSSR